LNFIFQPPVIKSKLKTTTMDATKKPLRIPPDFGIYAEEHEIFDLYKVD